MIRVNKGGRELLSNGKEGNEHNAMRSAGDETPPGCVHPIARYTRDRGILSDVYTINQLRTIVLRMTMTHRSLLSPLNTRNSTVSAIYS